jgi:hypothetical protein
METTVIAEITHICVISDHELAARHGVPSDPTAHGSVLTVDGNLERRTDLPHPNIAESPHALDQRGHRHALDRVKVDRTGSRHGVIGRFEHNLARESSNCRGARRHECSA